MSACRTHWLVWSAGESAWSVMFHPLVKIRLESSPLTSRILDIGDWPCAQAPSGGTSLEHFAKQFSAGQAPEGRGRSQLYQLININVDTNTALVALIWFVLLILCVVSYCIMSIRIIIIIIISAGQAGRGWQWTNISIIYISKPSCRPMFELPSLGPP